MSQVPYPLSFRCPASVLLSRTMAGDWHYQDEKVRVTFIKNLHHRKDGVQGTPQIDAHAHLDHHTAKSRSSSSCVFPFMRLRGALLTVVVSRYARVMRDCSWPEIEDQFAAVFGTRSKGGLTSVYYRVRRDWGLAEVLKSSPGSFAADCKEIDRRALNFSREFLAQIGFLGHREESTRLHGQST